MGRAATCGWVPILGGTALGGAAFMLALGGSEMGDRPQRWPACRGDSRTACAMAVTTALSGEFGASTPQSRWSYLRGDGTRAAMRSTTSSGVSTRSACLPPLCGLGQR